MNRRANRNLWLCLLAVLAVLPACVHPQGVRDADSVALADDEAEVGRIVEQVNAVESACEVTPRQLATMVVSCDRGLRDDCVRAGAEVSPHKME